MSASVDASGGVLRLGSLTIEIPAGALSRPTTISIREVPRPSWGAVGPAFDLGPDGLRFAVAPTLTISYEGLDLPSGTEAEGLRLSVLDRERWVAIADQARDPIASEVSARIAHFSVYGLVPEPRVATGVGTRLEANGITVEATASVYGRLVVSAYSLSLYLERDATDDVSLTFSGLPTDEDNYAYVRSFADERVLTPADGGTMTFSLDLGEPAIIWFQPVPGTTYIGGPTGSDTDECWRVGIQVGDVCRLTSDVSGSIELVAGTLDCDGRAIRQPFADRGKGTGIFIGPNAVHPVIRKCTIGGTDAQFGNGLVAFRTDGLVVSDNRSHDNVVGIVLQSATSSNVARNTVTGPSYWAIALWDAAAGNEIAGNSIAVGQDGITLDGLVNNPTSNTANVVHDNTVTGGTGGFLLAKAQGNEIRGNDREGGSSALAIFPAGWPNQVFWNNFAGWSALGLLVDPLVPPSPIEVSHDGKGNWWGHDCSGPLFTPGIDSNRLDVTDSFAYAARDAWATGGSPGCPGDADGDTVPDAVDNCPAVPNPGQENADGTGEGDACDATPPAPPVVSSPAQGAILTTADVVVRGIAESGSLVRIFLDDALFASVRTEADGRFTSAFWALGDGIHRLQADATDAAGNASGMCELLIFTVHTVRPSPPWILSPRPLELITASELMVEGDAVGAAEVRLLVDGVTVASVPVDGALRWSAEGVGPLSAGVHSLVGQSVDAWGLVSGPSQEIRLLVQPIESAAPALGDRGKLRIIALSDEPDPFIAGVENVEFSLGAESDAVHALGGRSTRNHAFALRAHWTVEDPRNGTELRTIDAVGTVDATHRPGGAVVTGEVAGTWDGRDSGGSLVPQAQQLAVHVRADLVRSYVGRGAGPPCSRDEDVLPDGPGSPSCLIDSVELRMASTTMAIPAPTLPATSIRIERGWTLREAVAVRFLAQDRYGVVGVLRGSPAVGGPQAHRVVFWVIEGDSSVTASYGRVISDPAGIEVWRNLGSAAEPTRHEIRGLRAAASQAGDGCALLAWRYEVNPPESCRDSPSGWMCTVERVGTGSVCPDGALGWPARSAEVTVGHRWDDPRMARSWIYGPAVVARDGEFAVAASSGSTADWAVRRGVDGTAVTHNQCWPPDTSCEEGLSGGHPTPDLPQLVWHPVMGRYLLGTVIRDVGHSIGCVFGTRIETNGSPLDPWCLEGDSRRFQGSIPLPELPRETFLSHAANARNPASNIIFATDHRVVWLDWSGSVIPAAANPQLDAGVRAVCEDWRIGPGSTVARAFRWTAEVLNPYDPWCTTPSVWARCLALSDPFRDPLATEELVYGMMPAPALYGRRFNWFLAEDCASAGTFDDPEMMLVDPGYRGVVVYMVRY